MGYIALGDLISKAQVEKCGKREYPVLSMTMHDGIVFQNDRFKKDIASIDRSNYSVVGFNQLVVSFPIDEGVLAVQDITDAGIVSPAYKIWDIDQAKLVPKYLEMWLRSPRSIDYYKAKLRGTTARRRSIPEEDFLGMRVNVLPMEEQERIVDLITRVNGVILLRKQQLSALDDLIKARFVEMFGDPVANTLEWKTALLREVTSKIGSGATPRGGKESYQAEGITLIRSMNVHDGRFEYKDLAHITDEQAAQLNNVSVEEGDVFINITGASVARSCIVSKDTLPARVNQHVAIIRCVRNLLNPTFANNMFLNDRFKEQLLDIGESGGATRQAITKQQLEGLTVILPPMNQQEEFAAFVAQIDKSKSVIQKSLDETQLLFDSLMQQYFG